MLKNLYEKQQKKLHKKNYGVFNWQQKQTD